MKILETQRLILREWRDDDIPSFAAMNQDLQVMKYFPATLTYEQSANFVDRQRRCFKEQGFCLFAVELKATNEFIGFVGLSIPTFKAHFTPCVEIGWRIASAYWNQGYATEAAKAVLQAAFTNYGLKEVVSFTSILNKPSIRVMEKLAMYHNPQDDFYHPNIAKNDPLSQHVLYRGAPILRSFTCAPQSPEKI